MTILVFVYLLLTFSICILLHCLMNIMCTLPFQLMCYIQFHTLLCIIYLYNFGGFIHELIYSLIYSLRYLLSNNYMADTLPGSGVCIAGNKIGHSFWSLLSTGLHTE